MQGQHDDLVMAAAIAYAVRHQQRMEDRTPPKEPGKATKWTADMWEDYRSAGPELREIMLKEWGKPR